MDKQDYGSALNMTDGQGNTVLAPEVPLCAAFSHASVLGFAIFDDWLRYQAVNQALVTINGFLADAHLGNTIRDLFGNHIADQIEPHVEKLDSLGKPAVFEVNGTLPNRSEPGSWIDHYFAIHGAAGKQIGIGLVVVEVTEQRKLDRFVNQLIRDLLSKQTTENCWLARELHDSIDQYHLALRLSIDQLTRRPDRTLDLSVSVVESLDERILAMRKLLAEVASRLPIQTSIPDGP